MLIYTRVPRSKPKKGKNKVVKTRKARKVFKTLKSPVDKPYQADGTEHLPSKIDEFLATVDPINPMPEKYEGEMAEREAAAQKEKQHKAKCVAPAFSKGPYTYIATEEQAKWVGRK